jgi:hypothetical protein
MSGGFGSGFSSGGNAVVNGQAGNAVPLPPVPAPDYVPIHGGQRLPRWREPTEKQGKWLRRIADKVKAHWAKQTRETPLRNAGSRGGLEEARYRELGCDENGRPIPARLPASLTRLTEPDGHDDEA